MKTKKARAEQRKLKQLKHVQDVAEAFLKARGVYPPDKEQFESVAGENESKIFYATMQICEMKLKKLGYAFDWFYSDLNGEWLYYFVDDTGVALKVIERETGLEMVCIG